MTRAMVLLPFLILLPLVTIFIMRGFCLIQIWAAPLTEPSGSVTWYGQIQIFRAGFEDNNEDFQLKITFGTNPAVDGSVGSIEGIV